MRDIIKIYIEQSINLATKEITVPLLHIPNDLSRQELNILKKIIGKEICIQLDDKESQKIGAQGKQKGKRVSTGAIDSKTD